MSIESHQYMLIVDDQLAICELLGEIFAAEGYHVQTALNSEQAVRAIRACTPGLIFMDINMPGKNGLETLKEVQSLISDVPVILITAYGEIEDIMDAGKRGLIQYYISKPFDIVSLIQLVKRIMLPDSGLKQKAANL